MYWINKLLDVLKLKENDYDINQINSYELNDSIDNIVYFKNGKLYKTSKSCKENWYDAHYLVSDGVLYDLESKYDLENIPVPFFEENDLMKGDGIAGSLEYVLKMKAWKLREKGMVEESDTLYKRIHLFMGASDHGYQEKDYLYYSRILLRELRFKESETEENKIKKYLNSLTFCNNRFGFCDDIQENLMAMTLESCKRLGTDLVVMSAHCSCCEECNKLQGRVYSISGKNKIFPKLPSKILKTGKVHDGCRHSFSAYVFWGDGEDTINDKMGKSVDAINASLRPYIDDRTEEEKKNYINYIQQKRKDSTKGRDEKEYYRIVSILPDIAPKSFSAYRRMKNAKTKNFMKLYDLAKENGIEIDLS